MRSPSRWAVELAVLLGALVVFAGLQEQGFGPGRAVSTMGVAVADAATGERNPTPRPADGRASVESVLTTRLDASVVAAALPSASLPDLLFDPSSLVAMDPAPRIEMPEMALRSDTIRPSEPIAGEPTKGEAATGALHPAALPLDAATAKAENAKTPAPPRLVGTWAADRSACARGKSAFLPLVIDAKGARAGGASCRFGRMQQDGNRWTVAATCRSGQETWAANIRLVVDGTRLTWSSERGTERYQRCR